MVSVANVAAGETSPARGLALVAAQCTGAMAATYVVHATAPAHLHDHLRPSGAPLPARIFALETTASCLCTAVALQYHNLGPHKALVNAGLVVAIAVATGATIEPSKTFAALYFVDDWQHHLEVCWAGPVLGAVLAGVGTRAARRLWSAPKAVKAD